MIRPHEVVGKAVKGFHTSRMGDTLGIEFADNTIMFIEVDADSYPDGSCETHIRFIDDASSHEAYSALLDLLDQKAPEQYKEIQKPLDEIAARKHREREEKLERADYERLKAKFEGVR
jgi:hypothetical protein